MKHLFLTACVLYFLTIYHVYAPSKTRPSSSRQREPSHSVRRSSRAPENVEPPKRTRPEKRDKRPPMATTTAALDKMNQAKVPRSDKPASSRKRHKDTTAGNHEIVVDFESENPTVKTTKKAYKIDPNAGPVTINIPSSGRKIKVSSRPKDPPRASPSNRKESYIVEPPKSRKESSRAVPSSRKPYIEEPPEPRGEKASRAVPSSRKGAYIVELPKAREEKVSRPVPSGSREPKTTSRTQQAHEAPTTTRVSAPPRQDPAIVNTGGKSGEEQPPPPTQHQSYEPQYHEPQYQHQTYQAEYQYPKEDQYGTYQTNDQYPTEDQYGTYQTNDQYQTQDQTYQTEDQYQSEVHPAQPPSPRSLSPESVNTSENSQTNHDWNENEYIFDRRYDIIGSGSFGKVYRVIRRSDGAQFALKEVPYSRVIHDKTEYRHTIEEITTLDALPHTVFVGLIAWYAGTHDDAFRFVLEWIPGGDFFTLQDSVITFGRTFKESEICYYGGQVLLGLHYMHTYLHRAYRDLKAENILVDLDGSIKLTDFGLVANLQNEDGTQKRATTMCGTPEFLAPEILLGESYTTEVDMWALGVFMYELRRGFTPFKPIGNETHMKMYENIVNYKKKNGKFVVDWDKNYFSSDFKSLLTHLLDREPRRRFTATDASEHRFFKACHAQWTSVNHKNFKTYFPTAPYRPKKKEHCLDRSRGCYEYTDSYGNLGYIPKEEEEGFSNF